MLDIVGGSGQTNKGALKLSLPKIGLHFSLVKVRCWVLPLHHTHILSFTGTHNSPKALISSFKKNERF
jgi:hypothetical protein